MENFHPINGRKNKLVVFVMGATGTGKSKLAVHLATRFSGEIINSDKMQFYRGLPVVTNKMPEDERRGIRHHLFNKVDPDKDYTATDFCYDASLAVACILDRGNIPIIAGGSNSYIKALVEGPKWQFRSKYECCCLWLDVSESVLHPFVSERVDQMVDVGLVNEVRAIFHPDADYSHGIRLSIGVPEMDSYFRAERKSDQFTRANMVKEAIQHIKDNTVELTRRQRGKICHLRTMPGWDVHRLNATDAVACRGAGPKAVEAWEMVVARAVAIIERFLHGSEGGKVATEKIKQTQILVAWSPYKVLQSGV